MFGTLLQVSATSTATGIVDVFNGFYDMFSVPINYILYFGLGTIVLFYVLKKLFSHN